MDCDNSSKSKIEGDDVSDTPPPRRNAFALPAGIPQLNIADTSPPNADISLLPTSPVPLKPKKSNIGAHINPGGPSARPSRINISVTKSATNLKEAKPPPQCGLTEQQKLAFKEVFDLFDSNGGGTIDAEELDQALRSVDIKLSKEEITEVLESMDKDGNGEIDFDEFLQLMTNTERFLESITGVSQEERIQRETLLFEALTQFMKKAALHAINEIVGYYHNKYKRAQAPHVIRHYADGARLIGLTERQMRQHMDDLRKLSADNKSPYAKPLLGSFYATRLKRKTEKDPRHPIIPSKVLNEQVDVPQSELYDVEHRGNGKIRLRFLSVCERGKDPPPNNRIAKSASCKKPCRDVSCRSCKNSHLPTTSDDGYKKRLPVKHDGWVSQRIRPTVVQLPALKTSIIQKVKCNRKMLSALKSSNLTFDHMEALRDHVGNMSRNYYQQIQLEKVGYARTHWHTLGTEFMSSKVLTKNFLKAFNAYTDYGTTPVSSLSF